MPRLLKGLQVLKVFQKWLLTFNLRLQRLVNIFIQGLEILNTYLLLFLQSLINLFDVLQTLLLIFLAHFLQDFCFHLQLADVTCHIALILCKQLIKLQNDLIQILSRRHHFHVFMILMLFTFLAILNLLLSTIKLI